MHTRAVRWSLGLLFLPLFLGLASADTHYVDLASTNPVPPYTNWVTAATNIQQAINAATEGESVVVTDGYYRVFTQVVVTNGATVRSAWGAAHTTVDGSWSNRCFYLNHSNALIDGFTVTHGRNTSGGGGVFADHGSAVRNCLIVSNSANGENWAYYGDHGDPGYGGGVYCDHGSFVERCDVAGNTANGGYGGGDPMWATPGGNGGDGHGGGVFADNSSVVRLCTIRGNSGNGGAAGYASTSSKLDGGSGFGGGVYLSNGSRLETCAVSNNTAYGQNADGPGGGATGTGSGGDGLGGGVYACNTSAVTSCSVVSNSTMAGGATGPGTPPWGDCCGGGVYAVNQCSVRDCSIRGNGALRRFAFSVAFSGTGGGLGLAGASRAVNCLVVDDLNGGVHCENSVLQNSTVASNTCEPPPSVAGVEAYSNSAVVNVISYFNQCFNWAGSGFSYSCTSTDPGGTGNITNDPQFVNAAAGNYHLLTNSPCIDTGTNLAAFGITNDLEGTERPLDGNNSGTAEFDMGCYEHGNPWADADSDGLSDYDERAKYGTDWTNPDTDGDTQGDGDEVWAGTDPVLGSSFFRVKWTGRSTNRDVLVRWLSVTNRWYAVGRGSNLVPVAEFWPLATNIPATPPENTYTDPAAPALYRFYRVGVER
ncbi:MAG: choice-of-anchor Q domain-containing protein [Verrucomicrobiota bacterium]